MENIYFIAEVGINHEGDFDSAMEHCRQAYEAGADAVKFQWVDADRAYEKGTDSYEIFSKAYLDIDKMKKINLFCRELGLDFFATPGDMESLYALAEINNQRVKISSGLSTHRYMIKESSKLFKNLIVSTGTLLLNEIIELNQFLIQYCDNFTLLKCTSQYPSEDENLNLDSIPYLNSLLGTEIGYSCHSKDSLPSIVAVTLGARVIEKHFSLSPNRKGFDHSISFSPSETKNLINHLERIFNIRYWDGNLPSKNELPMRDKMHRFMIAKYDMEIGTKIKLSDFYYKRIKSKDNSNLASSKISIDIEGKKLIKPCYRNTPLQLNSFIS